jgi:hypothetical protein
MTRAGSLVPPDQRHNPGQQLRSVTAMGPMALVSAPEPVAALNEVLTEVVDLRRAGHKHRPPRCRQHDRLQGADNDPDRYTPAPTGRATAAGR